MFNGQKVHGNVYQVGGPDISDDQDCCVYLIDFDPELVLIDAGAGRGIDTIIHNISGLGFDPRKLSRAVATHAHIDHVGGLIPICDRYKTRICAHTQDAEALERADERFTAASWYGITLSPIRVDERLEGEAGSWTFGNQTLYWLHTPGHTPGSISLYLDTDGKRVLFGQDIHGPFSESFGSDLSLWRKSMEKLLDLNADILCEGHFGIYHGRIKVRVYIESYLHRYSK
jgi:glyoxylase-like metal-dependent hydrolase (beta-lactamase superfamily II)